MDLFFLLKGMLLGFSIAVPVGPVGILCIRKTVQYGRLSGLCSGLGAALADVIYAVIAAFGLTYISDLLLQGQFWIHLGGGGFLIYLGLKTFFTKPFTPEAEQAPQKTLIADFFSTFFLTLTNPATILSFLAIFAGLGLSRASGTTLGAAYLVFGVFMGSVFWWLMLSGGVTLFKKKVNENTMRRMNRVAGIAISVFGLATWTSLCL